MKSLLVLMQLTDSNFPSGAFSHSFGLETFIQQGLVTSTNDFERFLNGYIEQLCYTDGLSARLTYEALETNNWAKIIDIDQLLYCSAAAKESRLGTQRIAQQLLKMYVELYPHEQLSAYAQLIRDKTCYGHPSITQAILLHTLQFEQEIAIQTVLYTSCSTIIQNAVRGIPLGQTDGQKMTVIATKHCAQAVAKIMTMSEQLLGCTAPLLEVKQMQHEQLHYRLFMS